MTLKEDVIKLVKSATYRKGSVQQRVASLILGNEFSKALSSSELVHLINEGPGKKVKTNDLAGAMEPLLEAGIVKIKLVGKRKYWFPAWVKKETISETIHEENVVGNLQLFNEVKLHPEVQRVSANLFRDEHYSQAIFEAFKQLEVYVKEKSGVDESGSSLMSHVFSVENPKLKLNALRDQTDKDEQKGYMFLFMGAMLGIRNPKGHRSIVQRDPTITLQILSLASLLFRKVDEAIAVSPT